MVAYNRIAWRVEQVFTEYFVTGVVGSVPGCGSESQKQTLSQHSHVAYIKSDVTKKRTSHYENKPIQIYRKFYH